MKIKLRKTIKDIEKKGESSKSMLVKVELVLFGSKAMRGVHKGIWGLYAEEGELPDGVRRCHLNPYRMYFTVGVIGGGGGRSHLALARGVVDGFRELGAEVEWVYDECDDEKAKLMNNLDDFRDSYIASAPGLIEPDCKVLPVNIALDVLKKWELYKLEYSDD
jgi:hypothetical protein